MDNKLFLPFVLLLFCVSTSAGESGSFILKAIVRPKLTLSLERTKVLNKRSVISLIARSNTYKIENYQQVEIENPLGLELFTEVIEIDGNSAQKEYRVTVENKSNMKIKNPFFTVKISAN